MMMLGTLFGLKTANVFAEKVIVDPSNPIQNVKNNFIIPKDVPNAKTNYCKRSVKSLQISC